MKKKHLLIEIPVNIIAICSDWYLYFHIKIIKQSWFWRPCLQDFQWTQIIEKWENYLCCPNVITGTMKTNFQLHSSAAEIFICSTSSSFPLHHTISHLLITLRLPTTIQIVAGIIWDFWRKLKSWFELVKYKMIVNHKLLKF